MEMVSGEALVIVGIILTFLTRRVQGQLGVGGCVADPTLCQSYDNGACVTVADLCSCLTNYAPDGTGKCSYNCGALTAPPNGGVSTNTGAYLDGAIATYSCNTGFILTGTTQRVCVETTSWSGTAPTCVAAQLGENCASDNTLCNNIANGGCVGSVCACNTGYEPDLTNLNCQRKDCGTPTVTDGTVNTVSSGTLYQAQATVTCNTGYTQTGGNSITCQADQTWTSGPTCTIEDCGQATVPNAALTYIPGTTYGDSATVTCDTGYTKSGTTFTITCQQGPSWSALPTCEIQDCGNPTAPTDGAVSSTNTLYQGVATFACNTGYDLTGTATRTCQPDGTWETPSPTCAIKDCGPLTAPANGATTLLTPGVTTYGATGFYSCNTGYATTGTVITNCNTEGVWSNPTPTCSRKDCGSLSAPTNGGVSYNPDTLYEAVATFTCDAGYDRNGAESRTCLQTGSWDSSSPTCVIKDCSTTSVANAVTNIGTVGTLYGAVVTVTCNAGYDQDSLTTMTCQADATWSTQPTCTIQDCGIPSVANAALTYTTTKYQDTVTVNCNNGYTQSGGSTLVCQDGASWSTGPVCTLKSLNDACAGHFDCTHITFAECNTGSSTCQCLTGYTEDGLGACEIHDCGTTSLANAQITITTTTYQSTAAVTCNTGYIQSGPTSITCQADGNWSPLPTCTIRDCGGTSVLNGQVDTSAGTEYLNTATVTCDTGYDQAGGTTITCQADGSWSTSPTCTIKDCGSLTVTNAVVDLTGGTTYQLVAPVTCNAGYNQDSLTTVTCQADGTWSTSPTCTLKVLNDPCATATDCAHMDNAECGTGSSTCVCITGFTDTYTAGSCLIYNCGVPVVADGVVDTSGGTTYGASVPVTCNAGYTQNGITSMQCQSDGNWSELPTCTIKNCGVPSIVNSVITTTGTEFEDQGTVTCNTGYIQSGGTLITCQSDGTWSYTGGPTCTIKDCGTPSITDGTVDTSSGTTYLEVAVVTCNTGYDQSGGTEITCQADASWSYTGGPSCTIKDCGNANVANAGVTYPFGQLYQSSAIVTCDAGYTQSAGTVITCEATGSWSTGPICTIKDCGTPSITNGVVSTPIGTEYQAVATVVCDIGYDLNGGTTLLCLASGNWDYAGGPTCVIKDCGPLNHPSNGAVNIPSGTTYTQTATFSCDSGYDLIGSAVLNCTSTGDWSDPDPVCQIKDCGTPSNPTNGVVDTSSGTTYGSSVVYNCNAGYDLVGTGSQTCQADGTWSLTPSTCLIKDCGTLTAPTFGVVNYNPNTEYQGLAEFTCDTGYSLVGSSSRACLATGLWGGATPTCVIKDCGSLTNPANGAVDLSGGTEYLGVATFTCATGYTLTGVSSTTCAADGNWDSASPTCVIKDCGVLASPDDGTVDLTQGTEYENTAVFSCNAGYNMVGTALRSCQADGTWETPFPTCEIKDCGSLSAPADGQVDTSSGTTYSQVATYSCDAGYDLSGSFTRTCAADGFWSLTIPACNRKDCGTLSSPGNGAVDLSSGTLFEAVAMYTCNIGYYVVGAETRECLSTGEWGGSTPVCIIQDCGTLTNPSNGMVDSSSGTTYQAVSSYTCDTGYTLTGVSTRTCESDGLWSDTEPVCIVNDCGLVAAPANGAVSAPSGTTYSQIATYTCDEGYKIATGGVTNRVCQADKTWSDSMPTCVLKDCESPPDLTDGYYVANQGNSFGAVVTYYCNTNYGLVGSNTVLCESTGFWGTLPECHPDCGIPVSIDHGSVTVPGGSLLGDTAIYTCDDGFTLSGSATVTCQSDMTWTSEPYCQLGQTAYNGVCFITTQCITSDSECLNDGVGSTRCLCQTSGWQYDAAIDQCLADCGGVTAPTNGQVDLPTLTVAGQIVTYSCDTGYAIEGVTTRTCLSTGLWSNSAPICVTGCPTPIPPTNGYVNTSNGLAAGSIIRYSCSSSYSLVGTEERICLKDTTWDGNVPVCSKECPSLSNIKHSIIDVSLGTWEGSVVTYICDKDYALIGTSTRQCEATGLWSGTEPECIFAIFPDALIIFGSLFIVLILVDIVILCFCIYFKYCKNSHERKKDEDEDEKSPKSEEEKYPDIFEEKLEHGLPPPTFTSNFRQPTYKKARNAKIAPEGLRHHPPPKPIAKKPQVSKPSPYIGGREGRSRLPPKGNYGNKPGFETAQYGQDAARYRESGPYGSIYPQTNSYQQGARQQSLRDLTVSADRSDIEGYINVDDLVKEGYQTTNSEDSGHKQAPSPAEEDHYINPPMDQQQHHQYRRQNRDSESDAEHQRHRTSELMDEASNKFKARMSLPVVQSEHQAHVDPDSERHYIDEKMRKHLKSSYNAYAGKHNGSNA